MKKFDVDEEFQRLLDKINNNEVRTTNELRIVLEKLEEKFNIKSLHLLVAFREWLSEKNMELLTENGMVTLEEK